ncbi:sensor histidine kinase [Pseudooceanicola marinus]|uniref:sensor histidine kinase n=1 Tax=Pseudooceanicola marinus TaxID=396013 RepID=UPI001CD4015C|nr:sensor histidine kinase [Pseudooceanicola marinus]MCA1334615.1 sensor histidine kinase N-terminal domain-containing protein [Pseudooceanicola marinus]
MADLLAPPRSLASRVLGAVLVILLLGGVLVTGSIWWNGQQAARQSYDRILLGAARDIAEAIRVQDGAPFVDLPVSAFQLLAQAPDDRIYYAVHGPGGELVTGLDARAPVAVPEAGEPGVSYFEASLHGEPARFVRLTRRFVERDFSGPVEVTVGQTLRARKAMTTELMLNALLPMALAGLVLMGIAALVLRRALRPLEALSEDLAGRDPHDLTPMPVAGLPSELQVMVGAMNRFMGRLEGQFAAMRNLIADSAHQLRTPVAAIRVQAETARAEGDGATRERALDRLLIRTRSLGRLLDQLLSRALVVHRTDSLPRVAVDLREVALEIFEEDDHATLSPGADLRLEIGEDPVMVMADAFSLGEAARNMLANALAHGQAPVTMGVAGGGARAQLWVEDAGPGPAPEVVEKLGTRFNRSSGSGERSTGIGFSIVTAVAEAFGGRVDLGQTDSGFRATLDLPAAPGEETP